MKVGEVIRLLESDGWQLVRTVCCRQGSLLRSIVGIGMWGLERVRGRVFFRGSHRQYGHPTKPGLVTVAGKPSTDIPPGTLNAILKQAQLKP